MKDSINRRNFLKGSVLGVSGVALATHMGEPAFAATGWEINDPEPVKTADGTISGLEITEDSFGYEFVWNGIPSEHRTITVDVSAQLPEDGVAYDTLDNGSFDVDESSGSLTYAATSTDGKWNTSANEGSLATEFPLDIINDHEVIELSDFETASGSKTTPVDLRITFDNTRINTEIILSFSVKVTAEGDWIIVADEEKTVASGDSLNVGGVNIASSGIGNVNGTLEVANTDGNPTTVLVDGTLNVGDGTNDGTVTVSNPDGNDNVLTVNGTLDVTTGSVVDIKS